MTLLKTVAELRLVQQCQDVARDLGRAVCLRERGLKSQVPTCARARSANPFLSGDFVLSIPLLEDSVSPVLAERAGTAMC